MIKRIVQYFRKRKEQKLRKELLLKVGTHSTTQAVQAWVEFILDGKTSKELLLSAGEDERLNNWIGLLGIQSRQSNASADIRSSYKDFTNLFIAE